MKPSNAINPDRNKLRAQAGPGSHAVVTTGDAGTPTFARGAPTRTIEMAGR